MRFYYKIDEDLTVKIYDTQRNMYAEIPMLIQPFDLAGNPWESREQAEEWAKAEIASLTA